MNIEYYSDQKREGKDAINNISPECLSTVYQAKRWRFRKKLYGVFRSSDLDLSVVTRSRCKLKGDCAFEVPAPRISITFGKVLYQNFKSRAKTNIYPPAFESS